MTGADRVGPVPPASASADLLASRVEDAGLNASAPPQQRWLDGWLLRLNPGKARRARCINAVAEGRLPLDEKLARAESAYRAAGLPLLLRITPFTRPAGLDAELAARGWREMDDTRVMICPTLPAVPPSSPPTRGLALVPLGPDDYAATVGALRSTPPAAIAAHAERLRCAPVPHRAFALQEAASGQVVACGQFALEDDLAGLYDVFTHPGHRGQGLASWLCRWLLAAAGAQGARSGYLQVEADNLPARRAYHRLGFADAYAYHYRTPDPDAW